MEIRREVIGWWLDEKPGAPGFKNKYRYYVEVLRDGTRIFLDRPAILNRGIDFQIKCEGFCLYKNGNCAPPSHGVVKSEFISILATSELGSGGREALAASLGAVWACKPFEFALQFVGRESSTRLERALKLTKWLFIEQDLTYWTETGRWKLRSHFEEVVGPFVGADD